MSAEGTIRNILTSNGITWFPVVAPHDEPAPLVVYQEMPSDLNIRTHEGDAAQRSRWQLTCWAYTYDEARELRDRVKALFHLNLTSFEFASVSSGPDLPDPDTSLYRKILEVFLWE